MTATVTTAATIPVREIVERLRIGRDAVYRLLENGDIPASRPGKRWIILRKRYERWEHGLEDREMDRK